MAMIACNRRGSMLMLVVVLGAATMILLLALVSFSMGSITFTAGRTNYISSLQVAETALNQGARHMNVDPNVLPAPIPQDLPVSGHTAIVNYLKNTAPGYIQGNLKMIKQLPDFIIGVGTDKQYTRVVRARYGVQPLPTAPSAMYMNAANVNPNVTGAAMTVHGEDFRALSTIANGSGAPVKGIGVTNAASLQSWIDLYNQNNMKSKKGNITGSGGTTPNLANVGNVLNIPNIASAYEAAATRIVTDTNISTNAVWGTPGDPEIVVVENSTRIQATLSGTGVLVVKGDLELRGNFTWQGLVLVLGSFTVGSGSAEVWGAMLLNKEDASININIGGSFDMRYSTEALGFLGNVTYLMKNTWEEF